jgi:hypothetical protein
LDSPLAGEALEDPGLFDSVAEIRRRAISLPSSQSTNSSTAADSASRNWPAVSGVVSSCLLNRSICVTITASAISASAIQFIRALSNVSLARAESKMLRLVGSDDEHQRERGQPER